MSALPNLIIIGAPKCGTTSLHSYLAEHPEIFMSTPKEARLFHRDDWRDRLDRYMSLFDADARVRGESTPNYALHPHFPHVPERIRSLVPDARLIYVVGDPVGRLASDWVQRYANGDREPFEQRLRAWRSDDPLVCGSLYATQLGEYLRVFDRSQLLVIDQEDLRTRRRETLREVFAFVGVDADFWSHAFDAERNTRGEKLARNRVGYPVWNRLVGPAVRRLPSRMREPVARRLIRVLLEKIESPRLTDQLRRAVEPALAAEVRRLRELTGKPFPNWSV